MTGHYSLDVHPEDLRATAATLGELSAHLRTKAGRVAATPGEIGSGWQGQAATSVKENMAALGQQMNRFDDRFHDASVALKNLAGHYEHALEVTIPDLNKRWADAQTVYDDAVAAADAQRTRSRESFDGPVNRAILQDLDDIRSTAVGNAAAARGRTQSSLDDEFEALKEELRGKTRTCGHALAAAVVVSVSDADVEEFRRRSAAAGHPDPMRVGALEQFDDTMFTLAGDRQKAADGAELARSLEDVAGDGLSQEELDRILADEASWNPAFRQAFIENLDPRFLVQMHYVAHNVGPGDEAQRYGELVTLIGEILAKGSRPDLQDGYDVPASTYDEIFDAYREYDDQGTGYALLAEIVQAGQGHSETWDTDTLTSVVDDIVAFEREMVAQDDMWGWSRITHQWTPITDAARDIFGDSGVPPMDPGQMAIDTLAYDPEGAQDFLTEQGHANEELLEYLYRRTAGASFEMFGSTLGGVLDAATRFVGDGGPGSRDYVSAEIVQNMVEFYGNNPDQWRLMMDQDVIDILTRFMPAVNHPGQTGRPVLAGDPDAPYSWQRLTLPNLDPDDLGTLMQQVFGTDYYTDDGSRPRFAQFAAVQATAMHADFLEYAAQHGLQGGYLENLATEQGELKQRTIDWFREAMVAQGRGEDESNADARAAADFMAGLLVDQIPVDKVVGPAGPAGYLTGKALDGIKSAALDQWFPLTDHAGEMQAEGHSEEIRNRVHGPDVYLNWLDEAGLLTGDAEPGGYAARNPGSSSFTVPGPDGQVRIDDIREMRNAAQAAVDEEDWDNPAIDRWEDFMRYFTEQGEPFLSDHDINTNFQLGTLVEASK